MVFSRLFRRQTEPDQQLSKGLSRTRRGVFTEITRLFDRGTFDEGSLRRTEMLLIQADLGWDISQNLVERLCGTSVEEHAITDPLFAKRVSLRERDGRLLELAHSQPQGQDPAARRAVRHPRRRRQRRRQDDDDRQAGRLSPALRPHGHAGGRRHLPRRRDRPAQDLGRAGRRAGHRTAAGLGPRRGRLRRDAGGAQPQRRRADRRHGRPPAHQVQPDGGADARSAASCRSMSTMRRRRCCS